MVWRAVGPTTKSAAKLRTHFQLRRLNQTMVGDMLAPEFSDYGFKRFSFLATRDSSST